jgi:MFS family permease
MRLWVVANAVSTIGTWMQLIAQNLLVLHLTGSAASAGLCLSAQALPGLVLGVFGGAAVDAWPRKATVMAGQFALGGVALATAALAASGHLTVGTLIALGIVSGIIATVEQPSTMLLGNELVPAEDLSSAIAVGSVVSSAGRLVGTAFAGVAVAAVGLPVAYLANGVSFLAVGCCIPLLRHRPIPLADESEAAEELIRNDGPWAGLRLLRASGPLLSLAATAAMCTLLGRNYSLTTAALVTGPMHLGAGSYGVVGAALGAGAIAGALVVGRIRSPRLRTVLALAAAGGGAQVVAGLSVSLPMLALVAVALAAAESGAETLTATLLQTTAPAAVRGRVLGAWRTAATAWGLAGPASMGLLVQAAGPRGGLVGGGVALLVIGGGVLAVQRVRRVRIVSRNVWKFPVCGMQTPSIQSSTPRAIPAASAGECAWR